MIEVRMGRNADGRFTGLCEIGGGDELTALLEKRRLPGENARRTMRRIIIEASAGLREKGCRHCFDVGPFLAAMLRVIAEADGLSLSGEAERILRELLGMPHTATTCRLVPKHRPGPDFKMGTMPVPGKEDPVLPRLSTFE